ncbi:MAG TPA: hypothetical protein PK175_06360 [Syntrophales bacterium]|nr:hypothetical protein [Syntrophales bacterium]HQG34474.1 hypothetical protein [Syntrophales bacterium]
MQGRIAFGGPSSYPMRLILFNIGLISLLGQVVLLRELAVASYGVELIYLFALGLWLTFTAVGALCGRRRLASPGIIAAAFFALAILLPLEVAFVRASRLLFAGVPGAYLPFSQQLLVPLLALFLPALVCGFLFPLAATLYIEDRPGAGRTLAGAYAIESLGALAGGIFTTISLKYQVPVIAVTLLTGAFTSLNIPLLPRRRGCRTVPAVVLAGFFLAVLPATASLERLTTRWHHPHLQESMDTAYGRITVSGRAGQTAVFENDVLAFETEGVEGETFAHLTALQHPRPRRVLLLGGGTAGIAPALRLHGAVEIDVVELDAGMVGMVTRHLPSEYRRELERAGLRFIYADPRAFLRRSGAYDLILVAMPEPASGQTNRFYTREFFRDCASRLRPGGILSLRLRAAENIWPPPLLHRMASIYQALAAAFPHVLFLPGGTNCITASADPLPEAAAPLIERWRERQLSARLVRPAYLEYLFTNDRFTEIRGLLTTASTAANSDLRPVCYRYSLQIWLSKFFPRASLLEIAMPRKAVLIPLLFLFLGLIAGVLYLARSSPRVGRVMLAGVAGFCGMILQNVLLLHYQVKEGVLYQDIGFLMACFMAGMAAGAMLPPFRPTFFPRRRGRAILAGFAVLSLLILVVLFRDGGTGMVAMACLLALSGFFSGTLFAHAARTGAAGDTATVSPLYAADLIGGAVGAFLGGLLLIPLAGLAVPVAAVGATILLSLLFA